MKKEKKLRERSFKLPIFKWVLWMIFTMVIVNIFTMFAAAFTRNESVLGFMAVLGGVFMLFVFKWHYRRSGFRGFLGGDHPTAWRLMLPEIIYCIISIVFATIPPSVYSMVFALEAGVLEEVLFRALPIALLMRAWNFDEKRMPLIQWITALVFGLMHISNVMAGAALGVSVYQAVLCVTTGVFFGAIFIRTGNLLPLMFSHFLQDAIAFLNEASNTGGIMGAVTLRADVVFDIVFSVVMIIMGIWYMRSEKRAEAAAVWKEIWSVKDSGPEAAEEIRELTEEE